MKKKDLVGTSNNDPTWILNLKEDIESINSKEGYDLLKTLFNDYLAEGMTPREALEKAKKVAKSFKF
ncbi:MAG: hypothetical protein JXA91_08365 [Candidatus Thermoplasmatota archaeon]|nr:hypothetical protein [Candidatus Thermoplasmatota archaeon]